MGVRGGEKEPERKLAELLARETGVSINPQALRMFIRAHWSKVSALAHDIHGEAADPKPNEDEGRAAYPAAGEGWR